MTTREKFDEAKAMHTGRCCTLIAESLAETLFQKGLWSLEPDSQAWLIIAAGRAYRAMGELGVDLMFDADGNYLAVVT